jgi:hypothetical protein
MAEIEQHTIAVCDAGPLIHLDELDSLVVLADFRVWIPDPVWQEVQQHRPSALQTSLLDGERCPVVGPVSAPLSTLSRAAALDAGELAALTIMTSVPDALFLTDVLPLGLSLNSLDIVCTAPSASSCGQSAADILTPQT